MLEAGWKDFTTVRRSSEPSTSTHSISYRFSVPSVCLPYRRRRSGGVEDDNHPGHDKLSLLTLSLSEPSFLESVVKDNRSNKPLYTIKTLDCATSLTRTDAYSGSVNVANIKWPKTLPTKVKGKEAATGVSIQMRGARWDGGENFLRPPTQRSSARKFHIPNYSHHMQWKRRRNGSYWCTTPSVKGPIATLDAAASYNECPKITVFETLHDKYDPRSLHVHQGVSIVLLDYLITTALLLVTDVQEWMLVRRCEAEELRVPDAAVGLPDTSLSDSQWRKIMFGEPIFPTLTDEADQVPPTQVSGSGPSRLRSNLSLSSDDQDEEEDDGSQARTRPPSPTAESMNSPLTNPSAQSHTYIDPLFYSRNRPPIPSLPLKHTRSLHSVKRLSSRSSTPSSTSSSRPLPLPPSQGPSTSPTPLLRPNSMVKGVVEQHDDSAEPISATTQSSSDYSFLSRPPTTPTTARPLPRTPRGAPKSDTIDNNNVDRSTTLRRAQSHAHIDSPSKIKRTQRSLPPTPGGPLTPRSQDDQHRQRPPLTKGSQEDLTRWVHMLTSGARDLPPEPLPRTSIFDVPPPSYDSITFDRRRSNGLPEVDR